MLKEEKEFRHNKVKILSLKNQKAFDKANRVGNKSHGKHMILITFFENSSSSTSAIDSAISTENCILAQDKNIIIYLGLKISKKVGKAVTRNKIRRRIKSIIYSLPEFLDTSLIHNRVIVIIPKRNLEVLSYSALRTEIVNLLTPKSY